MNGELPPSSSATRLSVRPAASPTSRPTCVEPVKQIMLMFGSVHSAAPGSASPGSTCNTPSGSPAAFSAAAMTKPPETGVCTSGLSTTVQPTASAGATERIERISGAFQGEITPTTPIGTRTAMLSTSSVFSITRRSPTCSAKPAASRSSPTATLTSKSPLGRMPPVSRTSKFGDLVVRGFEQIGGLAQDLRALGAGSAAQAGCAALARLAASAMSALLATPVRPIEAPVDLSVTSVVPPAASRQPLLKILPCHAAGSSRGCTRSSIIGLPPEHRDGATRLLRRRGKPIRARAAKGPE